MSYQDLLLHLDNAASCPARIEYAVRLAAQHGAHLTGLYPVVEIPLLNAIRSYIPPELQAHMVVEARASADAALAGFRLAAERAGIPYEARTDQAVDTTLSKVVAMHARYADLLVLGQVDPDDLFALGRHLPEEVALASGRPVLVVPCGWASARPVGERVVIAWDASREAARAVREALPLLVGASTVLVVTVNPETTALGHGELPGRALALHLARHGVKVEVRSVRVEDMKAAEALLSVAADDACDLLVMGAYGHSRVRELVLGGVTRTILKSMTLPVLMAH